MDVLTGDVDVPDVSVESFLAAEAAYDAASPVYLGVRCEDRDAFTAVTASVWAQVSRYSVREESAVAWALAATLAYLLRRIGPGEGCLIVEYLLMQGGLKWS